MSKINISDLAKQLADKKVLEQTEAELFIRKMFDVVNKGLENDKLVKVKWLGSFKVQAVKDRESVDVNTGDRIVIEGRDKITFTPDNILKEIVNKPFAQFETVVVNDGVDFDSIDQKFEHMEDKSDSEPKAEDALVEDSNVNNTSRISSVLEEASTHLANTQNFEKKENSVAQGEAKEEVREETNKETIEETKEETQEETQEEIHEQIDEQIDEVSYSEVDKGVSINKDEILAEETTKVDSVSVPTVNVPIEPSIEGEENAESEAIDDKRHFVIPRSVVVLAVLVVVALLGGMGYFAFNFGKMQAQRDQLAMQLKLHAMKPVVHRPVAPKPAAPSQEELLRKKALEDSIRMSKEAEAVKAAESVEKYEERPVEKEADEVNAVQANLTKDKNDKAQAKSSSQTNDKLSSSKYDQDPRIRTGAYRIVGVQQVVTAKGGQTVATISSRYLGPGMECYVEALNGSGQLKEGQKVKIPKLELKKKK